MLVLTYPTKYLLKKARKYQHMNFNVQKNVNQYIQRIIDNLFLIKILDTFSLEINNFRILLAKGKEAGAKNVIYGSLNSILPSGLESGNFSIFKISPDLTLYCFPPVCITAYDIILM